MNLTHKNARTMRTGVNRQSRKTKGFTLTEMILVMAIIGLLMSVLVPVFNRTMEMSRSAVCKGNLRGLGAFLLSSPSHKTDNPSGGAPALIPPMGWTQVISDAGVGRYTYCPSQDGEVIDTRATLAGIYIRQDGSAASVTPGVVITNMADMLLDNEVNDTQIHYTWGDRSNGSYENRGWGWVEELNGGNPPEDNQAMVTIATCAAFLITFEKDYVEFKPLGHHPNWNSGSSHWIAKGDPDDADGWEPDVLVRLTGQGYPTVNSPVKAKWVNRSDYGMNSLIPLRAYRPSQLFLVEYSHTVVQLSTGMIIDEPFDEDIDNGEVMARHLGRANFLRIDGSVADATKEELRIEYEQIDNPDVVENLWRR
ncbi:hypothetical protein LCGC14_0274410 [marine sediment metagenome]|uniref:Type II secretion system protein GspG C-terminal domain-containing protein n=1 Tax=marine sediment metagenome TaxID=412755 RepID=A0A0F9U2Q6_9ZZZZ